MSQETPRNLAASVRQRLFNRAHERHEDFGLVLTKYGLERFLHRLARSQYAPEDLRRLWLGHANKSVTDGYSKLKEDVPLRKKVVEQVGIGFELPAEKREVAPNCTQSELL